MNATVSPLFTDVPERIAQLIWVLCQTVTMRCGPRVRALSGEQVAYIVERLLTARKRFRTVVERIRAGNPPKPRARKPRARRVRPRRPRLSDLVRDMGYPAPPGWRRWARDDRARERAARKAAQEAVRAAAVASEPVPLWRTLRQHMFGWLCPLAASMPEFRDSAPAHANHLRQLLAEPEMRALLMSHRDVGDSLRKLCWSLGVERSLLYRAPTVVATPAPEPATATVATSENHVPGAGIVPPPPTVAGGAPSSLGSPGSRPESGFFRSG